ncbi:hypothetical protein [Actinomadura litoris]|uniref:hypothetical protein n=1 Tax=Actinomadura litoris TaxID=2678616 RepID=UPI001FA81477|nr:hypothetical protein [Actinomadura litoris]
MELNNGAEGGSNGVTVSAANSGGASGNAFDSTVGTPTITYDSAQARGTLAYKVVAGASAQQLVWSSSMGTQAELWGRLYLYSSGAPNSSNGLIRFLTGGSQAARLRYETTGALAIADSGNSPEFTTTNALATGQWTRVEFHIQFIATNAVVELRLYNSADSTTPTETQSVSNAAGMGVNCDTIQIGSFNSATMTVWMDGLQVNNTGWPGPIVGRPSPLVASRAATVRAARW